LTWSLDTVSTIRLAVDLGSVDRREALPGCRTGRSPTRSHSACPVWSSKYTWLILPILLPSAVDSGCGECTAEDPAEVVMAASLCRMSHTPDVRASRRGTRHAQLTPRGWRQTAPQAHKEVPGPKRVTAQAHWQVAATILEYFAELCVRRRYYAASARRTHRAHGEASPFCGEVRWRGAARLCLDRGHDLFLIPCGAGPPLTA